MHAKRLFFFLFILFLVFFSFLAALETNTNLFAAFLYAVEILPLQYRSQVQSGSSMGFWFLGFLVTYFGGEAAQTLKSGALIYIWFCTGGGLVTILASLFIVEIIFLLSLPKSTLILTESESANNILTRNSEEPQP